MKRSSGPRKAANLPESVHRQLNMYALAAGAAGVSMLGSAQPADAKIVYTRADKVIVGVFDLDSIMMASPTSSSGLESGRPKVQ